MSGFRKLAEEVVYRGSLVSAVRATFSAPDGQTFERDVVHHPGAVVVVPLVDHDTVLMVRQYRAAVDGELLELPAGKRDVDGEPVEETARRELIEEVGMRAGDLQLLARFYNSPGFCDELSWMFLAHDLTSCESSAQGVEETHMAVERVPLAQVPGLVSAGEIVDAKSIIGLCLTRESLGGGP